MNYLELFRANHRILSFGILLVFFSSFGQTFVVSLYIPSIVDHFGITRSLFSGMYAVATLLSAGTLIFIGKKIDHIPLKRFTLFVIAGILLACLLMAVSWHLAVVFLAIYLLRFFGQGLLSHTAMTTMSRYFVRARGKALGIAYLGFPMGEAILPLAVAGGISLFGWRETLLLSAALILLVLFPLGMRLISGFDKDMIREDKKAKPLIIKLPGETDGRIWKQREVFRSPWFLLFAPTVFLVGFLQTSLFFFQTFIADYKGWSMEWMAGSIVAYAMTSFVFSIGAGPFIDRFGARRLFPFLLIPLGAGLLLLSWSAHSAITPLYWLLVGITGGLNAPVLSALYAEMFGVRSLGAVRSMFTFVMVVSTALGPVVYSFFLDLGASFDQIHLGAVAVIGINVLLCLRWMIKSERSNQ